MIAFLAEELRQSLHSGISCDLCLWLPVCVMFMFCENHYLYLVLPYYICFSVLTPLLFVLCCGDRIVRGDRQ